MLLRERERERENTHTQEKTATEETRTTQNPKARKPQHKRQEELKTLKLETDLRQVEEVEAHPDCFRSNSSKLQSKSWMPQNNNRNPMTHYPDPSSKSCPNPSSNPVESKMCCQGSKLQNPDTRCACLPIDFLVVFPRGLLGKLSIDRGSTVWRITRFRRRAPWA
ncbi:hypothetical protein CY35_10G057100 [Sphagnum magellanicum]|nr:hypothetical protein CY35_10G057100 [Sphagnum magellanicum]